MIGARGLRVLVAAVAYLPACAAEPGVQAVDVDVDVDAGAREVAMESSADPCAELCARGATTDCSAPVDCVTRCERALADPCGPAWRTWIDCARVQPDSAFQCADGGERALASSACAHQQHAYADCVLFGP